MSQQIHNEQVRHPSAWYGRDLVNDPSWLVHLTQQDLAEIAAAVRGVKAHGMALGEVGEVTSRCRRLRQSSHDGWRKSAPAEASWSCVASTSPTTPTKTSA